MGSESWTPELCDYCKTKALIPGIIFPIASDGLTNHAYVECCDECKIFDDDDLAAEALSIYLNRPLGFAGVHHRPYISGMKFEDADKLKPQRYRFEEADEGNTT